MQSGDAVPNIGRLVESHYALLYRYAYRLSGSAADAEDLTQQTFLSAQAHLDQLRDTAQAKNWLCTILRHCYLKSLRKKKGRTAASVENLDELAVAVPNGSDVDSEKLQLALDLLPDEFKIPLVLFYFKEFSYKEIAQQLEVPLGTVMSRLSRAKAFLKKHLSGEEF